MPFSCKLTRSISVTQNEAEASCANNELMSGGIEDKFYLFNIDDIQGLKFLNDDRSDESLYVDTIITAQPYYFVQGSSVTYNETQDGTVYTHTLTANVNNISNIVQDILSDAAPGKYLVCFRPKGSTDWRLFGWKLGATMTHALNISESESNYVITLEDSSEFPLFEVKADNFDLTNKQFEPIFVPLYDVTYCELDSHGMQTGYYNIPYFVKVNSAGEPLGSDNKLCEYTHLPQDAYKLNTMPDGSYHILGTYTASQTFMGQLVRIYDPELCLPENTGTISWASQTVRLNSTTRMTASVNLTSNSAWAMVSDAPEYCTMSPNSGEGNSVVNFYYGRYGGDDEITVRNLNSYEETSITVHNRTVICGAGEEFPYGTEQFNIYCRAYGGTEGYTIQVDNPGLTLSPVYDTSDGVQRLVGYDAVVNDPTVTTTRSWTFTFTHADDNEEVKTATYTILAMDTTPYWRLMSQYCEENNI